MKRFYWVTLVLLVIGGLNWLLVGLFDFDLVAAVFGAFLLLYRARTWTLKRQMGRPERVSVANQPIAVEAAPVVVGAAPPAAMAEPVPVMAPEPAVEPSSPGQTS